MGLFGDADGWGGCWWILPKACDKHPTIMKLGSYTLPKEDPKNI